MKTARHITLGVVSALAAAALSLAAGVDAGPTPGRLGGTWHRLPPAPIAPDFVHGVSVWTGERLLVFGRDQITARDERGRPYSAGSRDVAAAYDPVARVWQRLTPLSRKGEVGRDTAVWTGKELLVWGSLESEAFNPATGRWRRLSRSLPNGLVVWTGREAIGWGGGCCGDASAEGVAYTPSANRWRRIPRSPLAASQSPLGAWTGRELVVLVSGMHDGKVVRGARAAAYDPARNAWRRVRPLPEPREGASAVWDGRELLVVGGTAAPRGARVPTPARTAFAFDPGTNRWRRLRSMPSGRVGAVAAWAGRRLVLWGGRTRLGASPRYARLALAYEPRRDRWLTLPQAPLPGRIAAGATWTGRRLLVWGVVDRGPEHWGDYGTAGAEFSPAR